MIPVNTSSERQDADLIAACLQGDAGAWELIINKYKRLIYSVPLRYQLSPDEAADVFQLVCIDLYRDLPKLREAGALRGWLARVAAHHSLRAKKRLRQHDSVEDAPEILSGDETDRAALETERAQVIREAISSLPPRCREMIRMLFYTEPPPSYDEVAARFGLAKGSIGFIRGRCLQKLEKALREAGL